MGNCCCPAANTCDSVEERSGLLQDASKATVPTPETGVVGAFPDSPEAEVDLKKTSDEAKITEDKVVSEQVKQSPQVRQLEPQKAQENGPLQEEFNQTSAPLPGQGAKPMAEAAIIAQDEQVKDTATDDRPVESQLCTLKSPQVECVVANQEVFTETNTVTEAKVSEELTVAAQDKILKGVSSEFCEVASENLTLGSESSTESVSLEQEHDEEKHKDDSSEKAFDNVHKLSRDSPICNEVLSSPESQQPVDPCQESSSVSDPETSLKVTLTEPVLQPSYPSSISSSGAVVKEADLEIGSNTKEHIAESLLVALHDPPEPSLGTDSIAIKHNDVAPAVTQPLSTSSSVANESVHTDDDRKAELQDDPIGLNEVPSLEDLTEEIEEGKTTPPKEEDKDVPKTEEDGEAVKGTEEASSEATAEAEIEGEKPNRRDAEKPAASTSTGMEEEEEEEDVPVSHLEALAEEGIGNSDEDLYRGAEELSTEAPEKPGRVPLFEITLAGVEDRCSVGQAVDMVSYSEREWKGNTAKSVLIRKGYKEMSQRFGSLRRVRGDNYCALRATLFQLLASSTQLPAWLQQEDIAVLPAELEAREGLISQWTFPGGCRQGNEEGDAAQQLKRYMELLRNRWQAAVGCSSAEERQHLCERVFQGGEEELGLLEALKLLMLSRAVELHASMQAGKDVPVFCWLLFARDSSECPRTFLSNHLSQVGFSGGLEQVEMFLLGYALQCTIQVYRLYMADTEEFVTYYPDDHKDEWPSVCLVTEDDRHYNVPVREATEPPEDESPS